MGKTCKLHKEKSSVWQGVEHVTLELSYQDNSGLRFDRGYGTWKMGHLNFIYSCFGGDFWRWTKPPGCYAVTTPVHLKWASTMKEKSKRWQPGNSNHCISLSPFLSWSKCLFLSRSLSLLPTFILLVNSSFSSSESDPTLEIIVSSQDHLTCLPSNTLCHYGSTKPMSGLLDSPIVFQFRVSLFCPVLFHSHSLSLFRFTPAWKWNSTLDYPALALHLVCHVNVMDNYLGD